jgi:hypothetical protein
MLALGLFYAPGPDRITIDVSGGHGGASGQTEALAGGSRAITFDGKLPAGIGGDGGTATLTFDERFAALSEAVAVVNAAGPGGEDRTYGRSIALTATPTYRGAAGAPGAPLRQGLAPVQALFAEEIAAGMPVHGLAALPAQATAPGH